MHGFTDCQVLGIVDLKHPRLAGVFLALCLTKLALNVPPLSHRKHWSPTPRNPQSFLLLKYALPFELDARMRHLSITLVSLFLALTHGKGKLLLKLLPLVVDEGGGAIAIDI